MNLDIAFERCKSFIDCQLRSDEDPPARKPRIASRPTVTLSRQTGSGAHVIAEKLALFLNQHDREAPIPWTVFDKNLVTKVLEDHHLPHRLAQFIGEGVKSSIHDAVEEMFGLHPSRWTLVEKTTDTIFRLAHMGNVILVGRGSAIIARNFPNSFHARIVGSADRRIASVQETLKLNDKEAFEYVTQEDRNRKHYLKTYFGEDIDNPLLYHLTINTDWISLEEAAQMLGETILRQIGKTQGT